eukprot:gnl/Dysnectes_brevis/4762_a6557_575.p1 GENE.gnl/Dysnectes_brevis/4762_a6557_575~~gnl/Dysnectes_brevis/4762_a6557_575.p1  ORF type:complete len:477 (+),score=101.49 gnl/Dysnectes_brevis/4762_a6557_575:90-1520(+)
MSEQKDTASSAASIHGGISTSPHTNVFAPTQISFIKSTASSPTKTITPHTQQEQAVANSLMLFAGVSALSSQKDAHKTSRVQVPHSFKISPSTTQALIGSKRDSLPYTPSLIKKAHHPETGVQPHTSSSQQRNTPALAAKLIAVPKQQKTTKKTKKQKQAASEAPRLTSRRARRSTKSDSGSSRSRRSDSDRSSQSTGSASGSSGTPSGPAEGEKVKFVTTLGFRWNGHRWINYKNGTTLTKEQMEQLLISKNISPSITIKKPATKRRPPRIKTHLQPPAKKTAPETSDRDSIVDQVGSKVLAASCSDAMDAMIGDQIITGLSASNKREACRIAKIRKCVMGGLEPVLPGGKVVGPRHVYPAMGPAETYGVKMPVGVDASARLLSACWVKSMQKLAGELEEAETRVSRAFGCMELTPTPEMISQTGTQLKHLLHAFKDRVDHLSSCQTLLLDFLCQHIKCCQQTTTDEPHVEDTPM